MPCSPSVTTWHSLSMYQSNLNDLDISVSSAIAKKKVLVQKSHYSNLKRLAFCQITVTKSDIMGSSSFTWVWLCCDECVHFPEVGLMFPTRSNYSSLVDSVLSICIKADPHLMGWLQWTHKDRLINKQINIVPTPKYSSIRNISKGAQWIYVHKTSGDLQYFRIPCSCAAWI